MIDIRHKHWTVAHQEHIWLLRAEGLEFKDIVARVGITRSHVYTAFYRFSRRVSWAMRMTTVAVHDGPDRGHDEPTYDERRAIAQVQAAILRARKDLQAHLVAASSIVGVDGVAHSKGDIQW